jgi:proline dehydrogenase
MSHLPQRSSRRLPRLPFVLAALSSALLLFLYGEKWLRATLLYLAGAGWARQLVTGFPPAWYVASRFIAGETRADAIAAARALNAKGMQVTLDYLGESVSTPDEARAARDEIIGVLETIHDSGVSSTVSVKLSQLGLKLDPELTFDNMRLILERARELGNFVRIDMEESAVVDRTLDVFYRLREAGFRNTGVVIQAYLYRSEGDVRRLIDEGASVRLCKGAYKEPPEVAYPAKGDVDDNFIRLMQLLLSDEARSHELYAGIATHDNSMIGATIDFARQAGLSPDKYEFQMLYGIGREAQDRLVRQGYRVRVYVPYGTAWYPYFMRRLAERPANLWFFLANLVRR